MFSSRSGEEGGRSSTVVESGLVIAFDLHRVIDQNAATDSPLCHVPIGPVQLRLRRRIAIILGYV